MCTYKKGVLNNLSPWNTIIMTIPYSGKFLKGSIFADG